MVPGGAVTVACETNRVSHACGKPRRGTTQAVLDHEAFVTFCLQQPRRAQISFWIRLASPDIVPRHGDQPWPAEACKAQLHIHDRAVDVGYHRLPDPCALKLAEYGRGRQKGMDRIGCR